MRSLDTTLAFSSVKTDLTPRRVSRAYVRILSKNIEILVVPAWIAGLQVREDAPETSISIWIPALHAGMT
jgi:hypothetical protein